MATGWEKVVLGLGTKVRSFGVLQSLPVAVFGIDPTHRVFLWNRACERLTGCSARAMIGTSEHWRAFYAEKKPTLADALLDGHLETHVAVAELYRDAVFSNHAAHYERWHEFPSGERRYLLIRAIVLEQDGAVRGAVEVIEDLTEQRKQLDSLLTEEARRREAEKMDALCRMAGGVAHDLNNLLTVILGYARLVRDGLGSDHSFTSDLDQILKAGERGAVLAQQLLAMSGKRVTLPKVINLGGLIADLMGMIRETVAPRIQVQVDYGTNITLVRADVTLVERAIMEIVENARDAMPNGGLLKIKITGEKISKSCKVVSGELSPGNYVCVTVTDTGCGISPEARPHIFEPFFTTKPNRQGNGLAVVWGILRQLDAHVDIHSAVGEGTSVTLFFPATSETPGAAAPLLEQHEKLVPRGTETVLVVEDEEIVRHLVVVMLKSLGYRVLEAADGREALRIASHYHGPLHLLLTDVVMPHLGGLELVKQLRGIRKDFRVLYMSGFTDGRLLDHGLLEPGDEIILKPYTRESLARKVRQVLDRK